MFYVRYFPKMPPHVKSCLFALNSQNLNKQKWLEAREIEVFLEEEGYASQPVGSKSSPKIDEAEESNKYNRNVLLVLDCVINGMRNLFSETDYDTYQKYKGLSSVA